MPHYYLETQTRFASGAEADALLASGWALLPDPPAYDPATQAPPEWNKTLHVWEVRALFADELRAVVLATLRQSLTNQVATMRQWSDDAESAVASWDGWTTAQRFAAMKTTLNRLGVFFDKFADLIETR